MEKRVTRKKREGLFKEIWKNKLAYLFLLPLMIGVVGFCYYPPIMAIVRSFTDWRVGGQVNFIGFDNYTRLFADTAFFKSIGNMFYLQIPKLIIGIAAPLIFAELLYWVKNKKLSSLYRILVLLPMVAPGVVNTYIWMYVFRSDGLLNAVLSLFRIESNVSWLNEAPLAIPALIFMGFPWIGGSSVLIYLSGLMNIPNEIVEAARLDGAKTMRIIWTLHIPAIMGQIRYFLVFGMIGAFQDYGMQVILNAGDLVTSEIINDALMVPSFYMYQQAFTNSEMGYACAVGTVIFVTVILVTILTFRIINPRKEK